MSDWQKSDHAKAMAIANGSSVLGDFADLTVSHYSQVARFYVEDGNYLIDFTEQGHSATYKAAYTFGHYPLQQYLVPTENGRFQVQLH